MIDCIQENGDISKIILYNGIQKNNPEGPMKTNHTEELLLGAFSEVPDPRASYNQKHRFTDILTITILATICGADTWDEIEDWGNTNLEWLKSFLVLENGIPSHDTFNRVFQMIDPKKLHEAFQTWVNGIITKLEGVIAIDGKTIRRSKEEISQTKPAHIVSAWANSLSMVLGQVKVDEKSNEITAIPELLKTLSIKGCIVTIDAMGTQKAIASQIVERGAEYILSLKENQGTLYQEVSEYFEKELFPQNKGELEKAGKYYKTLCQDHGRIETREYYLENGIDWMKDAKKEWKTLGAVGACRSRVEENGNVREYTRYMIISDGKMSAKTFGDSQRGHWGIENQLHWCLDIAFNEDSCRMRSKNVAENMNLIRHIALNLLKQEKSVKMGLKSKRKKCGWDKEYLYLVLSKLN